MAQSKNNPIEITVEFDPKCAVEYKKFTKKLDKRILKKIESDIEELKTNPRLGEKLFSDLLGLYSIHTYKNSYRILYDYIEKEKLIWILMIEKRDKFYKNAEKFRDEAEKARIREKVKQ